VQAGLGFTGEKNVDLPLNREWYCGRLTHFNYPVVSPGTATNLQLQLSIPEFNVQQSFSYRFVVDETANSVASGPCPYPSTTPCSDKITFDLGGLDFKKNFKIGQVDYTLQLTGFKESRASTSVPTDRFISNENRENNAFLFARIVAACLTNCVNGGTVQLITENGLKTCGCNCGTVACAAPKVLGKDCACACPPGTCNGAPTDASCGCLCPTPASAGLTCAPPKSAWDTTRCECTAAGASEDAACKGKADFSPCGAAGTDPSTWDLCSSACIGGRCVAKETKCAGQTPELSSCNSFGCNPKTGLCEAGPKPGKPCNDENSCTFNDICKQVGSQVVCQGEQKSCSGLAVGCDVWECLPEMGECSKVSNSTCAATTQKQSTTATATATVDATASESGTGTATIDDATAAASVATLSQLVMWGIAAAFASVD
jgi:hypothetical protein